MHYNHYCCDSFHIQTCDIDIDKEASNIKQCEQYMIITGLLDAENCQVFICSEQQELLESKSVKEGIIDLIATYFVFNIAYPKPVHGILLFLQHYVFQLTDNAPIPTTTMSLLGNLQRLNVVGHNMLITSFVKFSGMHIIFSAVQKSSSFSCNL